MGDPVEVPPAGRTEVVRRVGLDLEVLGRVPHRYAGTEGEREMLYLVRGRVPDGQKTRIEGFVAFTSPGFVVGAHALALLIGGIAGLRWPLAAALVCGIATLSLVSEGVGRFSWVRRVLPKSASYNLVWRRAWNDGRPPDPLGESAGPEPLGTLVVSAPLDAPRFQPQRPRWLRRPLQLVVIAAAALDVVIVLRAFALPWGHPTAGMYVLAIGLLMVALGIGVVAHRRAPGVEDASGPVALLELVRRFSADPPPGLDVWVVFTGCGHAYQNGMHAFLAMRGARLKGPALVIALSDPGRPALRAVTSEGPLVPVPHRPTGPALVERLRFAGLEVHASDTTASTDARAATLWGHRAIALRGVGARASAEDTLRAVDITEAIARLFAEDLQPEAERRPA